MKTKTTVHHAKKAIAKGLTGLSFLLATCLISGNAHAQNTFPANGNVGIGTTTPGEKLHVIGGALKVGLSTAQADRNINLLKIGDGDYIKIGEWDLDDRLSLYARQGYFFSGGSVGIGAIPSATNTLQVSGTIGISAVNVGGPAGIGGASLTIGNHVISTRISTNPGTLSFSNGITTYLFVADNGNVGIGTSSSPQNTSYKLSVAGSIRATEIVCETGWSDFVFDEKYRLRPLSEVESFIKTNKHLPEIPSAREVETNGVKMAEMESRLLQKIEELTLYAIEANKQIEALKAKIETLETGASHK